MRTPTPILALLAALVLSTLPACMSTSRHLEVMYGEIASADTEDDGLGSLQDNTRKKLARRVATVRKMHEKGEVVTDRDHFYAAAILVGSDEMADIELARELAEKAAWMGLDLGFRIVAEAVDKKRIKEGQPTQRYGTQFVYEPVLSSWRLYPVDPLTTDVERKAMGVPSLAELKRREQEINAAAAAMRSAK